MPRCVRRFHALLRVKRNSVLKRLRGNAVSVSSRPAHSSELLNDVILVAEHGQSDLQQPVARDYEVRMRTVKRLQTQYAQKGTYLS